MVEQVTHTKFRMSGMVDFVISKAKLERLPDADAYILQTLQERKDILVHHWGFINPILEVLTDVEEMRQRGVEPNAAGIYIEPAEDLTDWVHCALYFRATSTT